MLKRKFVYVLRSWGKCNASSLVNLSKEFSESCKICSKSKMKSRDSAHTCKDLPVVLPSSPGARSDKDG